MLSVIWWQLTKYDVTSHASLKIFHVALRNEEGLCSQVKYHVLDFQLFFLLHVQMLITPAGRA